MVYRCFRLVIFARKLLFMFVRIVYILEFIWLLNEVNVGSQLRKGGGG